jgi:hypothetical protein
MIRSVLYFDEKHDHRVWAKKAESATTRTVIMTANMPSEKAMIRSVSIVSERISAPQ